MNNSDISIIKDLQRWKHADLMTYMYFLGIAYLQPMGKIICFLNYNLIIVIVYVIVIQEFRTLVSP